MNPLLKLLVANRARGQFKVDARATNDEATIYLYDMIVDSDIEAEFWGGVSPEAFVKALKGLTAPTIHLRVKSPGGSVFGARAMEQAIREHPSEIIAHVDGLAASAASFLIMAADSIHMAPGSFMMIHKAMTIAWGNEDDLTQVSDLLRQIDGSLVKTYAKRTGQSPEDIRQWIAAETWMEADRAVELGFADLVADGEVESASARANTPAWDLSAFAKAPGSRQQAAVPPNPAAAAAPAPAAPPAAPVATQPDRAAMHRAVLKALIPA